MMLHSCLVPWVCACGKALPSVLTLISTLALLQVDFIKRFSNRTTGSFEFFVWPHFFLEDSGSTLPGFENRQLDGLIDSCSFCSLLRNVSAVTFARPQNVSFNIVVEEMRSDSLHQSGFNIQKPYSGRLWRNDWYNYRGFGGTFPSHLLSLLAKSTNLKLIRPSGGVETSCFCLHRKADEL